MYRLEHLPSAQFRCEILDSTSGGYSTIRHNEKEIKQNEQT